MWSLLIYEREREAANVESANRVLLYEREREAANVESANRVLLYEREREAANVESANRKRIKWSMCSVATEHWIVVQ